jgi:hypothetical protein
MGVTDMETISVAVVNATHDLDDDDVASGVEALQEQVRRHFGPAWQLSAELTPVRASSSRERRAPDPEGGERFREHLGLVLVDDEHAARELGYHDLTPSGMPIARVLVRRAVEKGQDWTHAASHELMEMLADPYLDRAAYERPDAATVRFYAVEVCDPCASYEDGYEIGGRCVSDFVFPAWFHGGEAARRHPQLDWQGRIGRPFEVRPGGYVGVFDTIARAWTVEGAREAADLNEVGSRLERRATARSRWRYSDMDWT